VRVLVPLLEFNQFGLLNKIETPAHSVNVLPWMEYQHEIFMQDGREMNFPVYLVPTVTWGPLTKGKKSYARSIRRRVTSSLIVAAIILWTTSI
jgi:hypothetical protein